MQLSKLPQHTAHIGRHGHNLAHDFSFTSGTGHLLTIFDAIMYPKDTIAGKCEMFTRTQPLLNPANVEIDEYIDYFFVPLDMIYSGFGDYIYQVNEPYSSIVKSMNVNVAEALPVLDFDQLVQQLPLYSGMDLATYADEYEKDWLFMSFYRNMFHNGINPNCFFNEYLAQQPNGANIYVHPVDIYQPNILPLTLLAYNCVYEHFYRLDDREIFEPGIYNIDEDVYQGNPIFDSVEQKAVSLKYRPKNFDYFTSINPRPFFNGASNIINGSELKHINSYLDENSIRTVTNTGTNSSNIGAKDFTQLAYDYNDFTPTTIGFRNLFAVEKLMQITSRAKKTYDAQVLAHLGVEVPHDVKHEIIHIGTQRSQVRVGEVVSTAGTSDTPLGDIAGKGYSSMDNNGIKFTAPVHGLFIGIYSAVPKFRYYAPLEKRNMITKRLDFFQPEYEKLGMQPVFGYEGMAQSDRANQILGWQMRYEQYKRRFNKVSPAFIDTIVNLSASQYNFDSLQTFNQWHNWVLARRPLDIQRNNISQELSLEHFLCGPDELNGLMAVDYWTALDYQTDAPLHQEFYTLNTVAEYDPAQPITYSSFAFNMAQFFYRDPLLHFCKPNFKVVNQMQDNTLPDFID